MAQHRISHLLMEHLSKKTGQALHEYISMEQNERKQMESEGITLANHVFESIAPYIYNIRVRML